MTEYAVFVERTKNDWRFVRGVKASSAETAANKVHKERKSGPKNISGGRYMVVPRNNQHYVEV